jgi:DNA repair protein RadC
MSPLPGLLLKGKNENKYNLERAGHNHPSGDLTPSAADKHITHRIIQAAEIIGIAIHEHLIVNMENDGYFSFAEQGYIQEAYDVIKKTNAA